MSDFEMCGSFHRHGGQTCIRRKDHDGLCRCRAVLGPKQSITYAEWESKDGEFVRHVRYKTIYAKNAREEG